MKTHNERGAGRKPYSDQTRNRKPLMVSLDQSVIAAIKADPRTNSSIVEDAVKLYLHLTKIKEI